MEACSMFTMSQTTLFSQWDLKVRYGVRWRWSGHCRSISNRRWRNRSNSRFRVRLRKVIQQIRLVIKQKSWTPYKKGAEKGQKCPLFCGLVRSSANKNRRNLDLTKFLRSSEVWWLYSSNFTRFQYWQVKRWFIKVYGDNFDPKGQKRGITENLWGLFVLSSDCLVCSWSANISCQSSSLRSARRIGRAGIYPYHFQSFGL